MRVRLAVFDMVGTTVRAGEEVPMAFFEAFRRSGLELSHEAVSEVRGRSKAEAIASIVAAHMGDNPHVSQTVGTIYATFQQLLQESYAKNPLPVPGARKVLDGLRDVGVDVVLSTGLDRVTADGLLQGLDWSDAEFSGMVTGDDVRHGRPAPDLIHEAMRLVGESESRAVLAVGDTVSDLDAAYAAGVGWNVGVLTGAHSLERLCGSPHSVILNSVADLPEWLWEVGVLAYEEP